MISEKLQQELVERLSAEIDQAYLPKIQELVPTDWQVLGVRVPKIRTIAATLHKANKTLTVADLTAMLDVAFAEQQREVVLCYIFWLQKHKRKLDATLWPAIDHWVDQIIDWEICDQLATGIAAPIVANNLELVDDLVAWTVSDNLWRRRFPAATASALNQKGRSLVNETLRICEPLLSDSENMVRKAVGWALRSATPHDPDAIYKFLLVNKTTAHRSIVRESSSKLTDAQRATLVVK